MKAPIVSLSKKLYSHCSVLVGSRNRIDCNLMSTMASVCRRSWKVCAVLCLKVVILILR